MRSKLPPQSKNLTLSDNSILISWASGAISANRSRARDCFAGSGTNSGSSGMTAIQLSDMLMPPRSLQAIPKTVASSFQSVMPIAFQPRYQIEMRVGRIYQCLRTQRYDRNNEIRQRKFASLSGQFAAQFRCRLPIIPPRLEVVRHPQSRG